VNYIKALNYAHHIAQVSRAVKDKKRHSKYIHKRKGDIQDDDPSINQVNLLDKLNKESYHGEDRRTGMDRRKNKISRGGYLESRQQKNRRCHCEVEITI